MSWMALYTNVVWTTAKTIQEKSRGHEPMCYSSEGYHPFSSLRVFDFSPCFEAVAILPVPLLGLILFAGIDLVYIKRKGPKKHRDGWSAWRMWMKTALLSLATVFAIVNVILLLVSLPHRFSNIFMLPAILHLIAMPVLLVLSHLNHQRSLRSSSVVLIFWPIYLSVIGVVLRTRINIVALGQQGESGGFGRSDGLGWTAFAMYLASVTLGIVAWLIECWGPDNSRITLKENVDYDGSAKPSDRKHSRRSLSRIRSSSNDSVRGNGAKPGYEPVFSDEADIPREDDEDRVDNYGNEIDGDSPLKKGIEEKIMMEDSESPVLRSNIYNRLTFGWLTPMMRLGAKRYIEEDDMWPLPSADSAESLNHRLESAWVDQRKKVEAGKKKHASLTIALIKAYGGPYLVAGVMKAVYDCLSFLQPQLLRLLLDFVQSYETTDEHGETRRQEPIRGFAIATAMFIAANLATFLLHQYFDRCFATTMRIRGGLVTLIYKKSLVLSNGEKGGRTTGDITNLQSVDATRVGDLTQYLHIAWSGPLQIILAFISLYRLIGWQSFVGVAIMVVSLPINTVISRYLKDLQKEQMKNKDARSRLMNEILTNIRSIKLRGRLLARLRVMPVDFSFTDGRRLSARKYLRMLTFSNINDLVRNNRELRMLRKIGIFNAFSFFFWSSTPFLVAFATFSTFALTSKTPLTAEKIFPAISLFQLLAFPLGVFSNIISSIIEAVVSIGRMEDFLNGEELQEDARLVEPAVSSDVAVDRQAEMVTIQNGEFRWLSTAPEPTLRDINLSIKKGELITVLGRVGDGKSSLLSSILGELHRDKGSVVVRGSIAYYNQNPFVLSDSIKQNILFGHRYDPELSPEQFAFSFYEKVIDACALRPDLAIFADGDATQVGGQRARIALARAVYARADLYLLDDPLSAAHVGKHIFDNVLGPEGLLRSKARILCTNAITWLENSDEIIMMRQGSILARSTYADAMRDSNSELNKLITGLGKQAEEVNEPSDEHSGDEASQDTAVNTDVDGESEDPTREERQSEIDDAQSGIPLANRRASVATMRRASMLSLRRSKIEAVRELKADSKPKEHSEKGQVKRAVYAEYIKAASRIGVAGFLLSIVLAQATSILGNVVLRYWGKRNSEMHQNVSTGKYPLAYGVVGLSSSVLSVLATVLLWVYCAIRCSRELHDRSFAALMRSPMSFFETVPMGRVLNIFTRDIFVIDEVLVRVFSAFFRTMASVIGTLAVIAFGAPVVLLMVIPLGFAYRVIMRYYLATSRELKRLDAVSRSPVFAWFSETLSGVSTIRAYGQQERFIANNEARLDRNMACYMPAQSVNRWLAVRLESLGSCLMYAAALTSVVGMLVSKRLDAGLVGLTMSYVISVTGSLNWAVRSASEVEQNIISVERVLGYTHLASEAPAETADDKDLPATWPSEGAIEFQHYSARYRPELDLCLRDISIKVQGGEKIGICGRTGAGKSSTTLALFRIIEAAQGKILIDGVDISTMGLKDLRRRLSIIPQSPEIFSGTLRMNIDPLNVHSDAEIWSALEKSHLKQFVSEQLTGGLDAEIDEGGSNLSAGQKQLVCFARALLRKTKILILDEATSSIDLETDEAVQGILRGPDFKGVTTLTIAHRINTIMDSDRVLVLDQGKVAEFDTPENLLSRSDSIFTSLVKQAGLYGNNAGDS
ncbi:hypothetical protein QFC21_004184 [Naganishia friedmannii]|uniref:Uncharacterized protein n=1 Tax=Naganishia friedmannii TaxID=89922 RepID=A0ACC2VJQ1_9TREE|nr:hypothetical protein QFC21_004184 [Naganishia friedmannii]